jgi:hypothetical protein
LAAAESLRVAKEQMQVDFGARQPLGVNCAGQPFCEAIHMKKIITGLSAAALALAGMTAVTLPEAAQAQVYTGRILCVAQSPYAYGYGSNVDGTLACQIALNQCSVRSPYGSVCYVTRTTYEVA